MTNQLFHQIPQREHKIDKRHISQNAINAINDLKKAGFSAYLVGGCVRDLLLGLHPKDFDVATDATPEQIVRIFKRARIIGRRFKIVHLYFGRELIEVTTFRGHHPEEDHPHAVRSATGQLLRDNIYGSLEEDALRRDFTANALYYDTDDHSLLDYVEGYPDIQQKLLRVIGDPAQRYQEDPVRMLRAARFCAKLGFKLEPGAQDQINRQRLHLNHIPAARLFDECLKLFLSGYGEAAFDILNQLDLFSLLFPYALGNNSSAQTLQLIRQALINTDQRLRQDKGVTPAFFFAVMLWPRYQSHYLQLADSNLPDSAKRHQAAHQAFSEQNEVTSIPKRFSLPARDIWDMQPILEYRPKNRIHKIMQQSRFRAAYDFLLLREQSGENLNGVSSWWTQIQQSDEASQQAMIASLTETGRKKRRNPRKRRPKQKK